MRIRTSTLIAAAIGTAIAPLVGHADDTYIGLNTTWSNPAAWSNNAPPTSTDNVYITPNLNPGDTNTLMLDTTATIANVTVGGSAGSTFLTLANSSLTATATTITANGQITGAGTLTSAINNAGTINASAGLLTITMPDHALASSNAGTLAASPGADLLLQGTYLSDPANGTLNNSGGTLSAFGAPTDSTPNTFVDLYNVAITGGQLLTSVSGQLRITLESSISNASISGNLLLQDALTLSNVTLSGNVNKSNFGLAALGGHITNNALFAPMNFALVSNTTIDGNGTINTHGISVRFPLSLTVGPSQTIQGDSSLGGSSLTALTNSGTITANSPTFPLSISAASNATFSNNGTLQAINGATLNIGSTPSTFNNANGLISATGTSSVVFLSNTSLSGGQLLTDASGSISLSNTNLSNLTFSGNLVFKTSLATFSNVTFAKSVTITSNGGIYLYGSITNNATWTIPAGASLFDANATQSLALSGSGTIQLAGGSLTGENTIPTIDLPAGQVIHGYGLFTVNVNNSSITADVPGQTLTFGVTTNNGTIAATDGGELDIRYYAIQNNGSITATRSASPTPNSIIRLGGPGGLTTLSGGTLSTDSRGQIFLSKINLSNTSLSGTFTCSGSPALQDSILTGTTTTTGILVLSGNITNNANWSAAALRINAVANLTGTGTLLLTGGGIERNTGGSATFSIASTSTLRGYGNINDLQAGSVSLSIQNHGTISADADPDSIGIPSTTPLNLFLTLPSTNSGTFAANNNGTLQLLGSPGAALDNTSGVINASGGNITLSNLSLTGGQLLSSTSNTLSFANVTLHGSITANATILANATTFAPGASLDLLHGALVVPISDASTRPAIQSALTAGALFTSTPSLAIAYIDNSSLASPFTTFAGQPVTADSLLITPALPGDANLDNRVDLSDLAAVLNNFGQFTPNWTAGNFDHTSAIDIIDLDTVLSHFGATTPNASAPSVAVNATPEPASLALLALGAAALVTLRKRR